MNLGIVPNIDRKSLLEKESIDRSRSLRFGADFLQRLNITRPIRFRFWKRPSYRLDHNRWVDRSAASPSNQRSPEYLRQPIEYAFATITVIDLPPGIDALSLPTAKP